MHFNEGTKSIYWSVVQEQQIKTIVAELHKMDMSDPHQQSKCTVGVHILNYIP